MSLTNYQVPLWSVILGIVILGEAPRQNLFLAMTLILIGLCLANMGVETPISPRINIHASGNRERFSASPLRQMQQLYPPFLPTMRRLHILPSHGSGVQSLIYGSKGALFHLIAPRHSRLRPALRVSQAGFDLPDSARFSATVERG